MREDLPLIRQPALIFSACGDRVVDPGDGFRYLDRIASRQKELIWLENSNHIASLDYGRDLLYSKTATFIKNL